MSNPAQDDYSINAEALQAEFEALQIPSNIAPRLLALWLEREQEAIEREQQKNFPPEKPKQYGRNLVRLFPAYIGIAIMCLSIVLGLIQGQDSTTILQSACIAFLVYTIIGFFVGMIAENCVNESVETLLREVVKRSRTAEETEPQQ